jgi:hypothetical protein
MFFVCVFLVCPSSRTRWVEAERRVVQDAFGYYLEKSDAKLPSFNQIGNLIKHSHIFSGRNIATIETWLHNQKRLNKQLENNSSYSRIATRKAATSQAS